MRDDERETIVTIPPVVRLVPIRIKLPLAVVGIHVEQMRVAVRVVLYETPSVPPPLESSRRRIPRVEFYSGPRTTRGSSPPALRTKYHQLFQLRTPLREKP